MLSLPRTRVLLLAGAVLAGLLAAGPGNSQPAANDGKTYTFKTNDGVELSGRLWAGSGKQDAVVLLIPDFDFRKGGGTIAKGDWGSLAKALNNAGYTVFGFDFRGFGDSTTVDPATFWRANKLLKPRVVAGKLPDKISYTNFHSNAYIPYLANDIAAAKAFLDGENDRKVCNTSNMILIGAGKGASLGAMWLAGECRRRKDTNPAGFGVPMLGDPEGKSVAAAVWLSIAPLPQGRLTAWVKEAGRANKIPMAFVYGEKETGPSPNLSRSLKTAIVGSSKEYKYTVTNGLKTGLSGEKLLGNALGLQKALIDKYLDPLLSDRRTKQQVTRDVAKSRFYYTNANGGAPRLNKAAGVEVPPVDVNFLLNIGVR